MPLFRREKRLIVHLPTIRGTVRETEFLSRHFYQTLLNAAFEIPLYTVHVFKLLCTIFGTLIPQTKERCRRCSSICWSVCLSVYLNFRLPSDDIVINLCLRVSN